jgi:hypothetical protein
MPMPKGALNPNAGRRKGTPNRVTTEFRDTVRKLLDDNRDNVARWLTAVAEGDGESVKPDPGKALDLVAKLAEFAAPKLARVEHAGDQNAPIRTVIEWAGDDKRGD